MPGGIAARTLGSETDARRSLWDADHILPVSEGGGECDLDNPRTLRLICHRQQTLVLRQRPRGAHDSKEMHRALRHEPTLDGKYPNSKQFSSING
jgi:hypothetical protein